MYNRSIKTVLKLNYGRPLSYNINRKSPHMKGFKRRLKKARRMQKLLNNLLKEGGRLSSRIKRIPLHQSRSLLAECIHLLRRQNRQIEKNDLQDKGNGKTLRKLLRKLSHHRSSSLFLKKYFNKAINEYKSMELSIEQREALLDFKTKMIRKFLRRNLKQADKCIQVTRFMIKNYLRYVRRIKRIKRIALKIPFEKDFCQFFIGTEVKKKGFSDNKKLPMPIQVQRSNLTPLVHHKREAKDTEKNKKIIDKSKIRGGRTTNLGSGSREVFYRRTEGCYKLGKLSKKSSEYPINHTTRVYQNLPKSKVNTTVDPRKLAPQKSENNITVGRKENLQSYQKYFPYLNPKIQQKIKVKNEQKILLADKKGNYKATELKAEGKSNEKDEVKENLQDAHKFTRIKTKKQKNKEKRIMAIDSYTNMQDFRGTETQSHFSIDEKENLQGSRKKIPYIRSTELQNKITKTKKSARAGKSKKEIRSFESFKSKFPKMKMWHRSHKKIPRKFIATKEETLKNLSSVLLDVPKKKTLKNLSSELLDVAKEKTLKNEPSELLDVAKEKTLKNEPSELLDVAKERTLKYEPSQLLGMIKKKPLRNKPSKLLNMDKEKTLKNEPSQLLGATKEKPLRNEPSELLDVGKVKTMKNEPSELLDVAKKTLKNEPSQLLGVTKKKPLRNEPSELLDGAKVKSLKNESSELLDVAKLKALKNELSQLLGETQEKPLRNDPSKLPNVDKSNNNETTKNILKVGNFNSFTYEKLKAARQVIGFKPTENNSVNEKKVTNSKDELNEPKNLGFSSRINVFKIKSKISRESVKRKSVESLLEKSPVKSTESFLHDTLPPMSLVADNIINRLFEDKGVHLNERKRLNKKIDLARMSLNTFLGTISKIKYGDRINAVWHDLVDNYKEWFSYAHSPEDIQKLKRILKWRYLHNVQKVLYNHIKYHKNDIDDDSSSIGSRRSQIRNNFVSSTNLGSLGIPKRLSHLDTSSTKPIHETFVRLQMEALRSRKFDKDLERMGNMIMHREVPTKPGDLEIFKRYKYDPQHFNVLILSQGKPISDEKFEEMLPVLERNFQYISNQLVLQSRQRRIRKMKAKNETRLAEAEVLSKTSFESCYTERTDFTADFVAKRREILAAYIAKLEKTPTEILLAKIRKQKKKDQLAKKAEERAQRKDQNRKAPKRRRSLSALFRAPRQTHRERQALQDIQEEQEEGRSPKSSATSMCCHRCSKCGLIWIDNCSDESTEGTVDHICPA